MSPKIRRTNDYIIYDVGVFLLLTLHYLAFDINSILYGQGLVLVGILSIIQLMRRYINNDVIIIFLFFSVTYLIYMLGFYFLSIPYHYLQDYQKIDYTNNVLFLQVMFIRLMFAGVNPNSLTIYNKVIQKRNNNFVFFIAVSILIIMAPISLYLSPPSISSVYTGEIQSSVWLEYCLIFIIIGSVYSNTKLKSNLLLAVSSVYLILPLLYGRRLQFIMVALAIFILYYSGRFKTKNILFLFVAIFIILRVYASVRMGVDMSIVDSLLSVDEDGVMGNNQGGVFVCAVTYWGLIEEGIFDLEFRLKSFLGIFTGIFLPASVNIKETYINFETLKYAPIPGNGGFPSIYLYIWGGYLGVIIGAFIFNFLLRNPNKSRLIYIYMVFVFATFPRWHSYNMFVLLKIGFWLMFFLAVFDTYHKYSKRLHNK